MTGAQRKDVDNLLGSFQHCHPQNVKVEEKNKKEVLVTFQLDDSPNPPKSWFFLGNWDGSTYQWRFQYEGMPNN